MSYHTLTLREFLERNVEGYLLGDLGRMRGWNERFEATEGGVSYPILQTAFAGIELLGGLTSEEEFSSSRTAGRAYFVSFWTSFLYPSPQNRPAVANAVYTLFRNGIAHTFLPKGLVGVGRDDPSIHLRRDDAGRVYIDAHQLAIDLRTAYLTHIRPASLGDQNTLGDRMNLRLAEMANHDNAKASALNVSETFPLM